MKEIQVALSIKDSDGDLELYINKESVRAVGDIEGLDVDLILDRERIISLQDVLAKIIDIMDNRL